MKFKKIYVEITNNCNLNCPFCIGNHRKKETISMDRFKILLTKLEGYTKYLYFHVMGEPLLHPQINELINMASKKFHVNITTNGFLIDKIQNNKNISKINISLHSAYTKSQDEINKYMDKIFSAVDKLVLNNTVINYRLWIDNDKKDIILKKLQEKYHIDFPLNRSVKLNDKIFFQIDKQFTWPSLDNSYTSDTGTCLGCREQLGILVDGTVVPCCLDSNGIIKLGNIYEPDLSDIINSKMFQGIKMGFEQNKKIHSLCRKCNFYDERKSS